MWCPRCNQGEVNRVIIIKTEEVVNICEECDALWPSGVNIGPSDFIDFATYVKPFGLRGLWSELKVLNNSEKSSGSSS